MSIKLINNYEATEPRNKRVSKEKLETSLVAVWVHVFFSSVAYVLTLNHGLRRGGGARWVGGWVWGGELFFSPV